MKDKAKEVGKTLGGVVCILAGMAITYFGVTIVLPKKHYSKSEISKID